MTRRPRKPLPVPTLTEELRAWRAGYRVVAGVDEAGRGPLAGPVVAAAVVLDPENGRPWWSEVRDSKQLTARRRERLADVIRAEAAHGIGVASSEEVDALGIVAATRLAMTRAIGALPDKPSYLLLDALKLPDLDVAQRSLIRGDALCPSIAAASIVAKVERDGMMAAFDARWPAYGFARNKGYGTPEHLRALAERGACPIHRRSFAPVRAWLEGELRPIDSD
jgi:ribonuclease HII